MAYEESDLESIHNMFEYNSDADKDYQPNYGDLTSSVCCSSRPQWLIYLISPTSTSISKLEWIEEDVINKGPYLRMDQHEPWLWMANFCEKALALVQSFSAGWIRSLEKLNREILSSFPNLVTGSSLLQLALTQLVQYYHRFQKLLTPNARAQLTNIHHIKVELKKYKTNF
ncbi:uncharacterized protein [Periplaneta americana]|uniref:uncharacterized protein isoform X1 n=1 Tax=Periplaneta americana TaxID=6978 RepID=UPI0037E70B4B